MTSDNGSDPNRRRFLVLAGASTAMAIAGCSGGGGSDGGTNTVDMSTVPPRYETANSIGGIQRDPDGLTAKEDVNYRSSPNSGEQCRGCQYYINDKNGDGFGACAIVAGKIDPKGWCVSYSAYEE